MTIDVFARRDTQEKTVALTSMNAPAFLAEIMLPVPTKLIITLVPVLMDSAEHTVKLISTTAW